MTDEPTQKKIIVDEDWKSRVEAEKEQLKHQQESRQAHPQDTAALPPPDLTFLASTMYMQAMVSMGLVPNPVTGKSETRLEQAKHVIDTLQMLWEKTEGNRTPEETMTLDGMLHELRLAYVAMHQAGAAAHSEQKPESS